MFIPAKLYRITTFQLRYYCYTRNPPIAPPIVAGQLTGSTEAGFFRSLPNALARPHPGLCDHLVRRGRRRPSPVQPAREAHRARLGAPTLYCLFDDAEDLAPRTAARCWREFQGVERERPRAGGVRGIVAEEGGQEAVCAE